MTTLKTRRLRMLQEKLTRLDRELIEEQQVMERVHVLIEAMDEADLQKVSGIIDKLRAVQQLAQDSKMLSGVIDKALQDLQQITGGDQSLGQKFLSLIKRGNNAKVFKNAMALVSALEDGFRLMPQLLKNALGPIQSGSEEANMKVFDIIAQRHGSKAEGLVREAGGDGGIAAQWQQNKDEDDLRKKKDATMKGLTDRHGLIVKNIVKAMKPSKWWGLASGKIPYVDNPEMLVNDILANVAVGQLMQLAQGLSGGPQASNLAQDVADAGAGGETQGTEGTAGTSPSVGSGERGTEETQGTEEPRARRVPTRGKRVAVDNNDLMADMARELQGSTQVDSADAFKILKALAKAGKLTEAVEAGHVQIAINENALKDLLQVG